MEIQVRLTPDWDGTTIRHLRVEIRADLAARAGEDLFVINRVTIFKPFAELSEPFCLTDEQGEIPLRFRHEQEGPVKKEVYAAERDSRGMLRLTYTAQLQPCGQNPTFDLGYEEGGMTGAGMGFMPGFAFEGKAMHTLSWDLTALPQRAMGVWSYGQGTVSREGGKEMLMTTFYAAGLLDCVRMGAFGYYWFPDRRIPETAMVTSQIFDYESAFFQDPGDVYTIIGRHTSDPATVRAGGTALDRSYMFIYREDAHISREWFIFLFAHEMVHNWIHLNDVPFGTCTWYVEGMAEYYSALLPWRMGIVDADALCRELNKRAGQYYENPMIHESNLSCGEALMKDPEKTRIPYGRGFFYLTHADAMIRQATGGDKCLDDLVMELNARFCQDQAIRNEAWLEVYGRYVGMETAEREHQALTEGGVAEPDITCFGGGIRMEKTEGRTRGSEEPCVLYRFLPQEGNAQS